ncbi:hypothetical protein ACVJBD_001451 [Rhizobium mongolense]
MPENLQKAAYQALISFEAEADKLMGALSIWGLPFRSFYSSVILGADVAFTGGRFKAVRHHERSVVHRFQGRFQLCETF